jgi:hypothetical protein
MSDISAAIEAWHDDPDTTLPLHEYLGMTWEQYATWAETMVLPADSPYTT